MSKSYTTLATVEQLDSIKNSRACVIIDCRFSLADTNQGEAHFNLSRIPRAQYAHLDRHLSSPIIAGVSGRHPLPNVQLLEKQFQLWGISSDTQIIAYDDKSGAIASRFWWLSRLLGHEHCAVLDGGFNAWKTANKPLETSEATTPNLGNFTRRQPLVSVIEKHQVLDSGFCLIDAREAERYRGEHEPIDPIAGHIPGALNAPFMENLDSDGRFLSTNDLQKRFNALLSKIDNKQLVHYCGSGVTAAHNMLAMAHAKLAPGALYAGSFSEWVAQESPDFPVVSVNEPSSL